MKKKTELTIYLLALKYTQNLTKSLTDKGKKDSQKIDGIGSKKQEIECMGEVPRPSNPIFLSPINIINQNTSHKWYKYKTRVLYTANE